MPIKIEALCSFEVEGQALLPPPIDTLHVRYPLGAPEGEKMEAVLSELRELVAKAEPEPVDYLIRKQDLITEIGRIRSATLQPIAYLEVSHEAKGEKK
ncbi:MAG: hypothetical protein Q7S15_01340 [bacterium]|nr:hypothetical protein [bacterium]